MTRNYFTADELERSANAPKYADVQPEQLFGLNAGPNLAARILEKNPVRYRELRREMQYRRGERKRPSRDYDGS
jgi:hypothetical protein